ncbi:MAG: NAD-dependent epimerase/dehydratase family protein, partial [Thermoplasmatota archaeon]
PMYGDGMQRRDWLYVADHAGAVDHVLRNGVAGEVYNVPGDRELPNREVVRLLLERGAKPDEDAFYHACEQSNTAFLDALAPRLTFTITTTHPTLWAAFWDTELYQAGLTGNVANGATCATGVQYSICNTASTATLNVYGPTTAVGSTVNDISFQLQTESLTIDLKATG